MKSGKEQRAKAFLDVLSTSVNLQEGVSRLFDEADKFFNELNIYGNAKHKGSIRSVESGLMAALNSLEKYTFASSLKEVTITEFKEALDLIKEPYFQYSPNISERLQTGFRKAAVILDHVHAVKGFSRYAKINRKSNTESSFEALIKTNTEGDMIKWVELANEFIEQLQTKNTKKARGAMVRLLKFLDQKYKVIPHPLSYLSKQRHKNFISEYKYFNKSYTSDLLHFFRFSEYVIDNYMTETEEDESTLFGYPIVTEAQVYGKEHQKSKPNKPHTDKLLIPSSLLFMMRDIISEDDFAFPKSLSNHYFDYTNQDGEITREFNPVASYVYLTMLEIPVRKIQVQMLDSGEGDVVEFRNGKWEPCSSEHSGYWQRKGVSVVNRGVLRELNDSRGAGFYINTNKTADINVGHGEHSGYTIPWYNQTLVSYFQKLRDFQTKYNPVKTALSYRDIDKSFLHNDGRPSEAILQQIPDRFYLFRNPSALEPQSPMSSNVLHRYFLDIMQEAEKRLQEQGEEIQIITKINEQTGQPERAIYSPHGLRVAGLTAMAENGVPIEVLSKIIAGHASILMTLHYIVYSDRKVTEVLNGARKKIETQAKQGLREWLKDAAFEDAKRYLHANNDAAIAQLLSNVDAAFLSANSYGVCPYAGTRCHDGGEEIKKATKTTKAKYGPVRGGKENCVMCRHFVTGKEWTIELWLHTNRLFEAINHLSVNLDDLRVRRKALSKERYEFIKKQQQHLIPVTLVDEIKSLDFIIEEKSETLNDTIYSAHAAYKIYNGTKNMLGIESHNHQDNLGSVAVTPKEEHDSACVETSKFASQHLLVVASRLYPQFEDSRVELERNHFVDQIYANSGLVPLSLAPMSAEEKKLALDAASEHLLTKLSDTELKNLHAGAVSIQELGIHQEKLISPLKESNNLLGSIKDDE